MDEKTLARQMFELELKVGRLESEIIKDRNQVKKTTTFKHELVGMQKMLGHQSKELQGLKHVYKKLGTQLKYHRYLAAALTVNAVMNTCGQYVFDKK